MIDVHTHILPGIDDGCATETEALESLEGLKNLGFKKFVLTPHIDPSMDRDKIPSMTQRYGEFVSVCRNKDLKYNLTLGAEMLLTLELFERPPKEPELFTIEGKNYQLIETPPLLHPAGFDAYIAYSRKNAIIPILAHIERYRTLLSDMPLRKRLKDNGFLFQVDLSSFSDSIDDNIRHNAINLFKEESIDLLASDCHSSRSLPPVEEGLNYITRHSSNSARFFKL